MVVLSFQPVNFSHRCSPKLRDNNRSITVRCGIAEPSGVPAPLGQKTKYTDGLFEKAFMTLFARKMEKFAASDSRSKSNTKGGKGAKSLFDYDYESFVDVSKRVMQGRSRLQQQQVVREVLLSMLPPGAPAQVINSFTLSVFEFVTRFK